MASGESLNAQWTDRYSDQDEVSGTYTEGHVDTTIIVAKQHRGRWQNIPSAQPAEVEVGVYNFATDEEHVGHFDMNGNGEYYKQAPGTIMKDGKEQEVTVVERLDSGVYRQGNAAIGGKALELVLLTADKL